MRILITGGTGFIGSNVIDNIINPNDSILAFSRKSQISKKENFLWTNIDLSDHALVQKKIREFKPEVLIHLAWEGIPNFSFDNSLKNLNNSIFLISNVVEVGSCKKIIISGSCLEYNKKIGKCHENQNIQPIDYFTWAKLSLLQYLHLISIENKFKYAWFRIFYAYGPKQKKTSLIPMIIEKFLSNLKPQLHNLNNFNDFIFISDIVDIIKKALNIDFSSGVYNLGSGKSTSIIEILGIVEKKILKSDEYYSYFKKNNINKISEINFWSNNDKSYKEFNFNPSTNLENGISQTVDFFINK